MENTNYGETEVLDSNYMQGGNPQYTEQQYTYQQQPNPQVANQPYMNQQSVNPPYANQPYMNQQYGNPQSAAPGGMRPLYQHPTDRSLVKMILLSLVTFGIYGIVVWCKMVTELNVAASRYDGKRTCPFFAMIFLTMYSFGIVGLVWEHNLSNRIGAEVRRRGYDYKFGASDFWLWGVLGSLIIVGPFVYCHKLLKCMNMINTNYNMFG